MTGAVNRFILFTDIAGSSRLADVYPREYAAALDRHNAQVFEAVERHGGLVYKNLGDGYIALFETARACADCAVTLQCALGELPPLAGSASVPLASSAEDGRPTGRPYPDSGDGSPATERLLVRLALHGGDLRQSDGEYFGPALNRASRICQVISGGQVVASAAVIGVLGSAGVPPAGARIDDLGEHHLRDLAEPEHLYQLDHPGFELHEFPPLATLNNRPNNLVEQPNRFIGRVKELAELEALLVGATPSVAPGGRGMAPPLPVAATRLLTIIAPGGYGKSRIAAQLCANLLPQFERGCFMVYLAPVRDVIDVPMAIGSALGYQFSAGRTPEQQICDYLRNKELLLCLDNLEHLLERAPLIADILKAAPKVKIVITSREPLRIPGEHIYRLDPLPVHASAEQEYSEAVRLFADRAVLVSSGFHVDSGNLELVEHICEHLSGIPLAIELAAAWMDSYTLSELHEELGQQMEIEARSSLVEARHQSLKACLDWSWNLLGAEQQEMLMRLSVFRGGFFADAASAVLNRKGMALRAALAKLCDKSWLYAREVDSQTRFFLRDMLAHEYAFAKLESTRSGGDPPPSGEDQGPRVESEGEEQSLYETAVCAHAAYFAALAEREGPRLSGGGTPDGGAAQMQALRTWRLELANIEEALDNALKRGNAEWLLPIAMHLHSCYFLGASFVTMQARYAQLLTEAAALGNPDVLIQARIGLAYAHQRLGQYGEALSLMLCSQAQARQRGDRKGEAHSLGILGFVHNALGDYAKAMELQGQALVIRREIGDRDGVGASLGNLGSIHHALGDYGKAAELQGQAMAIKREIGDRQGEAVSLGNLATCHHALGDHNKGAELERQVLVIFREIGVRLGEATCLGNLGIVHTMLGDYAMAMELQGQSLAIRREIGDRHGEAYSLGNLAGVRHLQGDHLGEAEYYDQALTIFREIGARPDICFCCTSASSALAALRALREAAIALHGGLAQANAIYYRFQPDERQLIDGARARLDSAVAAGEITAQQLAAWQAEGEALSLDELADFVQTALAELLAPGD